MSHTFTATPVIFDGTVLLPDDGDADSAAGDNASSEELANGLLSATNRVLAEENLSVSTISRVASLELKVRRVDTINVPSNWTCPAGVTEVDIDFWGGGGGGASSYAGATIGSQSKIGGPGGSGSVMQVRRRIAVTPGTVYPIVPGSGGAGEGASGGTASSAGSNSTAFSEVAKGGRPAAGVNSSSGSGQSVKGANPVPTGVIETFNTSATYNISASYVPGSGGAAGNYFVSGNSLNGVESMQGRLGGAGGSAGLTNGAVGASQCVGGGGGGGGGGGPGGVGGIGGSGGNGAPDASGTAASTGVAGSSAPANSGGGGGGGGAGGSAIVTSLQTVGPASAGAYGGSGKVLIYYVGAQAVIT